MSYCYKDLVLSCLEQKFYPALQDHVFIDIYYKMIEPDENCSLVRACNSMYEAPEIVYEKENDLFNLLFFTGEKNTFCAYKMSSFDPNKYQTKCFSVRLRRSVINNTLKLNCNTVEEEIYMLLAQLNTNVTKIHTLLDLSFIESTRFVPQYIQTWATRYTSQPLTGCVTSPERFGPTLHDFEVRLLNGKLSKCSSSECILSLNNDIDWDLPCKNYNPYNMHYSTRWKTIFPLAYNPLENPIIHT